MKSIDLLKNLNFFLNVELLCETFLDLCMCLVVKRNTNVKTVIMMASAGASPFREMKHLVHDLTCPSNGKSIESLRRT